MDIAIPRNEVEGTKLLIGFILLLLILVGCVVTYITFSILYLIEYYNTASKCENSHLWEYLLVSLVLSIVNFKVDSKEDESERKIIAIVILGITDLGLSIWGGIELWDKCCDELRNTYLWTFSLISFFTQLLAVFICIVLPAIMLCYSAFVKRPRDRLNDSIDV